VGLEDLAVQQDLLNHLLHQHRLYQVNLGAPVHLVSLDPPVTIQDLVAQNRQEQIL